MQPTSALAADWQIVSQQCGIAPQWKVDVPSQLVNGNAVRARCPDCAGAVSLFDYRDSSREYGLIIQGGRHRFEGRRFGRTVWRLLCCAGCGRGGLAQIHDQADHGSPPALGAFFPRSLIVSPLPTAVPEGIVHEFREAERCASVEAWRAASSMLRSVLEKTLQANGYTSGSLKSKIDDAGNDGVITAARKQKAHVDIRVLGNEVVHDEWRPVDRSEVESALHYAQRVLEDLYDDRRSVEAVLHAKGRITASAG